MASLVTDTRHAIRSLAKNPGFAVVALATIALGVGANTAVFSVVNATLIQALPYPESERLLVIRETIRRATVETRSFSYPGFLDWQRETRGVTGMAANEFARFTLTPGDTPERLDGELVSWNYFDVLGVTPALGRGFRPDDDRQGDAPVIVLSDALWMRAFNRDPSAVGRTIRVDDELTTIVGVMPAGFLGLSDSALLWAPIGRFTDAATVASRGDRWIEGVVARPAPGVTAAALQAEMDAVAARLEQMYPDYNRHRGVAVVSLRDNFFGGMRGLLLVLLGAVGFVLLIACVNVANLLLARGAARQRELAVRCALGADRRRIVGQLLTESVTLSALGGAVGLLAASWSVDLIVALGPGSFPTFVQVGIDARVLAFTFAVCVMSGLLFGVVPAVVGSRADLVTTLKMGGRDGADSGTAMLRRGLVAAEIALALVLLIGAGLMLRTMDRLRALDPGFRPDGLVMARVALPPDTSADQQAVAASTAQFARSLLEQVRAIPGVDQASLASDVPLGSSSSATIARLPGRDVEPIRIYHHAVSPGHFRTLGMPLLGGRDFTDDDDGAAAQSVAIISRTMAERYWPAGDALHKTLLFSNRTYEIVGVVGDVQHRNLLEPDTADPDVYRPIFQQLASRAFAIVTRTAGDAQPVSAAIREAVRSLNADAPVFAITTGAELVTQQTSRTRFSGTLLGSFAVVALALTIVGIYGVTAYTVSRQTRQVGIRMALGATRGDVLRLVLRGGLTLITAGLAAGILAAFALTRLLSSLIYGVTATDPATFAVVTSLLAVVALVACFVPAARATRIDPVVALRSE